MASVTELVDLICQDTGLSDASPSDDRSVALARLNHAYRRLGTQLLLLHEPFTIDVASGTRNLDLREVEGLGDPMRFIALDTIQTVDSSDNLSEPLPKISTAAARRIQAGASAGVPVEYAFQWPYLILDCESDGSVDFEVWATVQPYELVESEAGDYTETSPTALEPSWHETLLAQLAIVLVLERYEGREQDASYHRNLYNEAMAEYRSLWARRGGRGSAQDTHATSQFNTPSPTRTR